MTKTALVTGANRGLGLEVCKQLLALGYNVWLAARRREAGEEAARALASPRVLPVVLDVTSDDSVQSLANQVRQRGATIEALVNNAAVSFDGFDEDVVRATLATNLFGALRVTDAVLPHLATGAAVVNVSSGMGTLSVLGAERRRQVESVRSRSDLLAIVEEFAADVGAGRHRERGWPSNAYSVSKVALNAFTRVLADQQPGLRVNAVCPGWVRTAMGGPGAPRAVEEGARGIVWAATLSQDGPTGGFFRDGRSIAW
jgi:NAD(P)-dependent dehydrogenase (short-subunit alcohol dehydrogenase family)